MDKVMDKAMVDNALTAKEAKEMTNAAMGAYAEPIVPEIMAEIFAQIRFAAKNEKTYINDLNIFVEYRHHAYLYGCIKTILEGMGYSVDKDAESYMLYISWHNAE